MQKNALFIMNSCTQAGSEIKTLKIAKDLSCKSISTHIHYLNKPDPPEKFLNKRVKIHCGDRKGKLDLAFIRFIAQYIEKHSIENVFCLNLYPCLYGFLAKVFLHRKTDLRIHALVNITDLPTRSARAQMLVYAPVLRSLSKVVFGCRTQRDQWIRRYRLDPSKCTYIYNGVDCADFAPLPEQERHRLRATFGLSPLETVVVCVAGFRPVKRHLDLIAACRTLKGKERPFRLLLAGDGPERARLQKVARESGVDDRVLFLGHLEDVRPVLAAADGFALCSSSETFSNAALEAMAMAKPVVLSHTGGAPEMVVEGVNGFLFPPGDIEALTAKLGRWVDDPALPASMGACARRMVEQNFTYANMIRSYVRLIGGESSGWRQADHETAYCPR